MTRAVAPQSLEEATRLLAEDSNLVPVAGCTDLMVTDPVSRADLPGVIDLLGVPELSGIRRHGDGLEIGATTTFTEIGRSPEVERLYPALAAAARTVGGWQIQNRATIGGNMANASPAGDSLPVLLALEASVVIAGARGERLMAYSEFHVGYRETALAPGELIAAVRLPPQPENAIQGFRKIGTREAQAISKVVVALVGAAAGTEITHYRLAAGSVAATPVRLPSVEEAIEGREPNEETASLAGRLAAQAVEPIDDVRSTAEYRRFALDRAVRRLTLAIGAA